MTNIEVKSKVDEACRVAEEFTKLYYDYMDKRRHLITKFYREDAISSWNGNGISRNTDIQAFIQTLPPSDHTLTTLDAQPILDSAVYKRSYLIQVSGSVKYQDRTPKTFQQSFIVSAQEDKWKIVTDCFRTQEPLTK